jgi:hypothetical protein
MSDRPAGEAHLLLDRLRSDLNALGALELSACAADEVLALTIRLEQVIRTVPVVQHRLVTELESRSIAAENGCASTARLLTQILRLHPAEAKARVAAAAALGSRRSLTGQQLEPVFAATAAAQAAGTISVEHARIIVDTIDALPASVAAEHDLAVEALLLERALDSNPAPLARDARRVVDYLDPDGTAPRDEDHRRRRGLHLSTRVDGSGTIRGNLTPACLAVVKAFLEPLAAPHPATGDVDPAGGGNDAQSRAGEWVPDPRTAPQRLHDALEDAGMRLLTDGGLPITGGTPAMLVLTMTQDQFQTRQGTAHTSDGDLLSIPEALRLGDQAEIASIVFDAEGGIANFGRERRTASLGQRIALAARDGGCCFPGCTQPPDRCQAHHVIAWQDGGVTDLENLALLCGWHHRAFERLGYTCRMIKGRPHWTKPPWLDPDQRPRPNTAHRRAPLEQAVPTRRDE